MINTKNTKRPAEEIDAEAPEITRRQAFVIACVMFAVFLAVVLLVIKGCAWLMKPEIAEPRAGDRVLLREETTGWQELGDLQTYDLERLTDSSKARRTLRKARKQKTNRLVPYITGGRVLKVAQKPHDTPNGEVYGVQVEFYEYGTLWLRSSDVLVDEECRAVKALRAGNRVHLKDWHLPYGHLAWRNLSMLKEDNELHASGREDDLTRAIRIRNAAERIGSTISIPDGEVLEVKQVSEELDPDGLPYVQIRYNGQDWWLQALDLDLERM